MTTQSHHASHADPGESPVRTIAVGVGGTAGMIAFAWAAEEAARDGVWPVRVCAASAVPIERYEGSLR